MPLPTPRKGEDRKKFVSRCTSAVMQKGEAKDNKQAVAMCFSQARRSKGTRNQVRHQQQHITVNWDLDNVRKEMLGGRSHLVVPMVMMVEGVHRGSNGPVLYTANELKRTVKSWNHKPIVLNHPKRNGKYVSACVAPVLDEYKVGLVLNAKFVNTNKGPGQKAEAWLDEELLSSRSSEITNNIQAKKPVSVSTGLFTDIELGAGKWQDEVYIGVTTNHQPDHLALVPNQEGACSQKKGCGLLLNTDPEQEPDEMKTKKELVDELLTNKESGWSVDERDALMNLSEKRIQQLIDEANAKVTANNKAKTDPAPTPAPAPTQHACTCGAQHQPQPVANVTAPAITSKKLTDDEWMAQAPPRVQEMIRNMQAREEEQKAELIATITSNENNKFSEEYLKTKNLEELDAIAALAHKPSQPAPKPAPMFYGGAPVRNVKQHEEEALTVPTVNDLFPKTDKLGAA
jgi:hypothetical protein